MQLLKLGFIVQVFENNTVIVTLWFHQEQTEDYDYTYKLKL